MIEDVLGITILLEAAILLALSYKTVVRKPVKRLLEDVEAAHLLLIPLFIGASLFLAFTISALIKNHLQWIDEAPIDHQLVQAHKLLQASLLGMCLFLSMLIYKFNHLMRARTSLNKALKVEEKQLEDWKYNIAVRAYKLECKVGRLEAGLKELKFEYLRKSREAEAKAAVASELKKQCEGFNLKYDRELEYNQTLRNQLLSIDQTLLEDKQELSSWTGLKESILRDGLNLLSPWKILEPSNNVSEECSDNNPATSNGCYQTLHSGTSAPSSPRHRHRRPVYQTSY